ncbi:amidohydrolase family protein [Aliidiomarina sanyensis]|uniref:Amidohydrolase-related domain-containing protein n=1 Tax=Aliidiomarina sanyensis TaxID=1249555 RepID=A0A432WBQ6_9GAMM|nr:amidohydrolase family protein [Aliidiomarina sanyensis]RUO29488.1 hypothetical protein CWE11_09580 [Aliidiomarina sanyensis]
MKNSLHAFALGWLVLSSSAFAVTESETSSSILYTNATIVQPDQQQVTPNGYLWVVDGRFRAVGATRPESSTDAQVIDLAGAYVMPGFIDTHAHMSLGAVSFSMMDGEFLLHAENQLEIGQWNAKKLLEFGVTSIRNPGGDTRANLAYRDAQIAGELLGPRAYVAGAILNTDPFAGLVVNVDNQVAIQSAVTYQAEQGVDFIKLYTGLNEQQVDVAVQAARDYNLPVIGHLESLSWTRGAELGIQHFVHAMPISPELLPYHLRESYQAEQRPGTFSFFEWYDAVDLSSNEMRTMIDTLVRHAVKVDPTLIVFYNAFFGDQLDVTAHPQMAHAHPQLVENWRDFYHFNLGWSEDDFARAQAVWPKVLELVNTLYLAGVKLSIGTDLGNPWVIPGVSYFQEMRLLNEAGIPPFEVLRLATENGALVLGMGHELGKLEVGYIADFLVFEQNPAEDLSHLDTLLQVIQSGEEVFASDNKRDSYSQ